MRIIRILIYPDSNFVEGNPDNWHSIVNDGCLINGWLFKKD